MSTPTTQSWSVQSAPVQPVRGTSTDTRAMASIRPMAMSPMTSTVATTTPTATVMPTSVVISDGQYPS